MSSDTLYTLYDYVPSPLQLGLPSTHIECGFFAAFYFCNATLCYQSKDTDFNVVYERATIIQELGNYDYSPVGEEPNIYLVSATFGLDEEKLYAHIFCVLEHENDVYVVFSSKSACTGNCQPCYRRLNNTALPSWEVWNDNLDLANLRNQKQKTLPNSIQEIVRNAVLWEYSEHPDILDRTWDQLRIVGLQSGRIGHV